MRKIKGEGRESGRFTAAAVRVEADAQYIVLSQTDYAGNENIVVIPTRKVRKLLEAIVDEVSECRH